MDYTNLYKKTEQYVTKLYNEHPKPNLTYHNIQHTRYVVAKANEIAGHYQLSERDMLIIFIAAWFHDTGYLISTRELHEEKSVELMNGFLEKHQLTELSTQIGGCIMATKFPRNPKGLLEEIICDADTYNLGSKDFKDSNKAVFQELNLIIPGGISKSKFDISTLKMMEHHEFYTTYCREQLTDRKNQNMKKIKNKIQSNEEEDIGPQITEKEGTTKGMQTMLRLTSTNHIQLSEMADNKANILISVNAIIISVILSVLLRRLTTDPYLTIPTIIFLLSAVATIIVAILATRPKVTGGTFEEHDIVNKKTNLLFFGNFHKVPLEQYNRAMRTMMKDSDYLYSSIVQDIYHLGAVLGKKYKLIRLAYNIFMIGIILSVLAFAFAAYMTSGPGGPDATITNQTGSPF